MSFFIGLLIIFNYMVFFKKIFYITQNILEFPNALLIYPI